MHAHTMCTCTCLTLGFPRGPRYPLYEITQAVLGNKKALECKPLPVSKVMHNIIIWEGVHADGQDHVQAMFAESAASRFSSL